MRLQKNVALIFDISLRLAPDPGRYGERTQVCCSSGLLECELFAEVQTKRRDYAGKCEGMRD